MTDNNNEQSLRRHFEGRLAKKKNKMFAVVLSVIEEEAKKYGVKDEFFSALNGSGFSRIRTTLLDEGNHLTKIFSYILDFVHSYSSIKLTNEVIEDALKGNNNDK